MLRKHFDMNSFHAGQNCEREKLKREIHDGLAQEIFGLQMLADQLNVQIEKNAPLELIEKFKSQLTRTVCCLKGIIDGRLPENILNQDLEEALRACFSFDTSDSLFILGKSELRIEKNGIGYELFRICQEFIANSLRHSEAKK